LGAFERAGAAVRYFRMHAELKMDGLRETLLPTQMLPTSAAGLAQFLRECVRPQAQAGGTAGEV